MLPNALRKRIDALTCRHSFAHMIEHCGLPGVHAWEVLPTATPPLVWDHGASGKSLFLNPPYMVQIDGLAYTDTRALVEELTAHATRPDPTRPDHALRHRWHRDALLIWDNRWTMHRVLPYDLTHEPRVMRGATLAGMSAPGGRCPGASAVDG